MAKLKDPSYQKQFEQNGFNYLKMLNNDELQQLQNLYATKVATGNEPGLYFSHNSGKGDFNVEISEQIQGILKNAFERTFENYEYFYGAFSVKKANTSDEFELHQDWNIVEESKYVNLQLWIPLELSYPENGGMFFLPGSQRFFNNYRSADFDVPHLKNTPQLNKAIVATRLLPCDVAVFNSSTFHGSYPNTTDYDRVAVLICMYTKGAPVYYFSNNKQQGNTQLYHFNSKLMLNNIGELITGKIGPDYKPAGTLPLPETNNTDIKEEILLQKYHAFTHDPVTGQYIRPKARRIIKSDELENEINDKGYAVVKFINDDEIAYLKQKIQEHLGWVKDGPARIVSIKDETPEVRIKSAQIIRDTCKRRLDELFYDCKPEGSIFYIKRSGIKDTISVHFNPSLLLNEHLEMQLGIWCPLVDTDEHNGGIQVIPGSHRWDDYLTARTIGNMFAEHSEHYSAMLKTIPLKAGEAIIWDDRIAHSSNDNNSGKDRLTFLMRFTHKDARLISLFKEKDEITVYEQDDEWKTHPDWDDTDTRPKIGVPVGVIRNYKASLESSGYSPTPSAPGNHEKEATLEATPEKKSVWSSLLTKILGN